MLTLSARCLCGCGSAAHDPLASTEPTLGEDTAGARAPAANAELHELPGLCSHFIVDRDGTIFQLAPLRRLCRHTVG